MRLTYRNSDGGILKQRLSSWESASSRFDDLAPLNVKLNMSNHLVVVHAAVHGEK